MDGESDLLGEIMDMVSGDLANDLGDTALLDVALPNGPSAPPGPRYVTTGGVAIQLLPVFQWGKFTPALNSLLARAKDVEADGICYASVETQFTAAALDSLAQEVFRASETKTLVAGVAFPGLHAFDAGASRPSPAEGVATKRVPLSGLTSPWNTLALWRVDLVGLVGFPPVADGIPSEGVRAGVEEVTAITLLQTLCSESKAGAKLVRLNDDDASLFTDFRASRDGAEHEGRSAWHADKMRSKLSRAAAQVGVLQRDAAVVTGSVLHVDARHRRPSL